MMVPTAMHIAHFDTTTLSEVLTRKFNLTLSRIRETPRRSPAPDYAVESTHQGPQQVHHEAAHH